jgi:Spy/CpxP family protein refolding chaperone
MNKMFNKPMMRATMLALCATLLGTVPVVAQDNAPAPPQQQDNAPPPSPPQDRMGPPANGRGRMNSERQLERMTKQLNLSPDQVTQIKAINEDTRKQSMAVRDDSTIAQADKRDKMMDIHKASQDKIRAVLNDEQKTKYDDMMAKMRERMGNRGGGDNAPAPPPPPPPPAPPQL